MNNAKKTAFGLPLLNDAEFDSLVERDDVTEIEYQGCQGRSNELSFYTVHYRNGKTENFYTKRGGF